MSSSTITLLPSNSSSSNLSLKRRRPPTIEIPSVLSELGIDEIKRRDKIFQEESIEFDGLGVGVFAKKGKKKLMEDTHKIVSSLNGDSKKGFFGVYDGHGGRKAAEFVAENLHGNILGMLEKCECNSEKEEAVKAGYMKTDEEFMKQGLSSGTCCVTCLIEEKDIVISNVGDCRAVLCRGGVAEVLTIDHRADNETERNRIENKGGYVENHRGAWRVHGILAVSRSIGDIHLKDWVPAEPDTKILTMTLDMDFIILASDGLWEKVSNQEAVDTVMRVRLGERPRSVSDAWKEDENEFGCENMCPPSKVRRISSVSEQKVKTQFPMSVCLFQDKPGSTVDPQREDENEFSCENTCPPPRKENKIAFGCEKTSSPSKVQRTSVLNKQKANTQFPMRVRIGQEQPGSTIDPRREDENEFGCDNTMLSRKAHSVLPVKQQKPKTQSPMQKLIGYKKILTSSTLMDACKELANVAMTRGSLDDITVMIIDLERFRRNT